MTEKQLKELIREEYHNVKDFMEEKYGFTPELGKVIDNPYVSAFKKESTDDTISEELRPDEVEFIIKKLGNSMPNHTSYDYDKGPTDAQVLKALKKYHIDFFRHSTTNQKKEIVKGIQKYLTESTDEALSDYEKKGAKYDKIYKGYKYKKKSKKNEGGDDSEMAVSQLNRSLDYARMLIDKLRGKGDLDAWVQSYITKAEDYLNTTFDYYKGKEGEIQEYDVETIEETQDFINFMKEYKSDINEAEYQGRDVKLGKPMQGDVKKFKVYVKNDKGNVVKVNFGAKGMNIKKNNPERRKSFRARHNCDNPGPRWKARYWSCRKW